MTEYEQRLCDVLDICHTAHRLGIEEYGTYRVHREWPGAMPKRKGLTKKYIKRILKAHKYEIVRGSLTYYEERMLLHAYDQGLYTRYVREDKEYGTPIPLKVQPKSRSRIFQ